MFVREGKVLIRICNRCKCKLEGCDRVAVTFLPFPRKDPAYTVTVDLCTTCNEVVQQSILFPDEGKAIKAKIEV